MMKNGFPPACCAIRSARRLVQALSRVPGELGRVVERERLQVQVHRVPAPATPIRAIVQQRVPSRAHHEQRDVVGLAHHLLDEVEHRRLGRLDVLEHHDDRASAGEPAEEREQARADLGDAVALLVPGLPADPERDAQALDDLPSLVGRVALDDDLLEPRPQRVRRRVRRLPHLVQEDLRERPERHVLLERTRPAQQDLRLVGESRDELVGHPALADPRLAEQRHQVSAPRLARAVERVLQQPQLALAVDERDRPAARARLQRGDRPRARLVLEPLGLDLAHRPVLDLRQREEVARLRDQHGSRVGGLLQPRRQVHRGAVEQALLGRLGADRDGARVDADADPERDREPDLLARAARPGRRAQPGPNGAERVVVVRVLQAEDPDDGVAGEVVGAAAERLELLGDHAVVAGQDLAVALGVDLAGEPGRPDEVDEDHRDELALLRRRGAHRVAAVRAEAGLVGERKPAPFTRQGRHAESIRGRDDGSPRSGRLPSDPEALDVEDRARALGFGPDDDLDALADLERLVPGSSTRWISTASAPSSRTAPSVSGLLERLALDPLEHDRERDELAAGADLGVGRRAPRSSARRTAAPGRTCTSSARTASRAGRRAP